MEEHMVGKLLDCLKLTVWWPLKPINAKHFKSIHTTMV
jgi:hypothetical protein